MTQGRGFIAVAVVMFADRSRSGCRPASYLFGAALALSPALQARGYAINQFALDAAAVRRHDRRARGPRPPRSRQETPGELQKVFEIAPAT